MRFDCEIAVYSRLQVAPCSPRRNLGKQRLEGTPRPTMMVIVRPAGIVILLWAQHRVTQIAKLLDSLQRLSPEVTLDVGIAPHDPVPKHDRAPGHLHRSQAQALYQ